MFLISKEYVQQHQDQCYPPPKKKVLGKDMLAPVVVVERSPLPLIHDPTSFPLSALFPSGLDCPCPFPLSLGFIVLISVLHCHLKPCEVPLIRHI